MDHYNIFIILCMFIPTDAKINILHPFNAEAAPGGGPRGLRPQTRTVFIKKFILLTKNAYYNMDHYMTCTSM
jgi:hypothetical protein